MQCQSVVGVIVDAFDDVDFAAVGPVGTDHPERWPGIGWPLANDLLVSIKVVGCERAYQVPQIPPGM